MMKIMFNVPKPVVIKAGQHTAKKTGFLFERRIAEGSKVTVSQSFLDKHKEKTGRDFTSSWLERVDALPEDSPEDDEQVVRELEEAKLREELESLGVEVDKRWGVSRLKDEIEKAKADQ